MPSISDRIERYLCSEIAESGSLSLSRRRLAERFNCAPSQVSYVLQTRFTVDRGYAVESKRGGGGYMTLTRLPDGRDAELKRLVSTSLGSALTLQKSVNILERLLDGGLITEREHAVISAAVSDRALKSCGKGASELRSHIFGAVILALLKAED